MRSVQTPSAATTERRRQDAPTRTISGGMVAFNEEQNIRASLRSLLDQDLPDGMQWSTIWVVASGCTDRTVKIVRTIAKSDPRVKLIVEPDRGGKARALDLIIQRADGEALVLLNSDARAEPGAIRALWNATLEKSPPYAVMARPVVPDESSSSTARIMGMVWSLHHEFHLDSLSSGRGNHLSDELLLLSRPGIPAVPEGVINDGAYIGAWLDRDGGTRVYAPSARVAIQVPQTLADYITQRRRILVGHSQIVELLGWTPSTLPSLAFSDPGAAVRIVWR